MEQEIIIQNIDRVIFERLTLEAERQGTEIKTIIVQLVKRSLGLEKIVDKNINYYDFNYLAGTWSNEDYINFKTNTSEFNQIGKN
ncbi:MAG: hypothetical protein B6D61_09530 [Bacteroidetes bacterium 4484_249]|nr:MAG: hypothetical protein B6D61_09530 [Bacteroidetes bacterium 4484_249]